MIVNSIFLIYVCICYYAEITYSYSSYIRGKLTDMGIYDIGAITRLNS